MNANCHMEPVFSADEINKAQELKSLGLAWVPSVGHYVFDFSNLIEAPSPFQEGVYFILDLKHFVRRAGSIEALPERLCWLPDWKQSRHILQELGCSVTDQLAVLNHSQTLRDGTELLQLYQLIENRLGS